MSDSKGQFFAVDVRCFAAACEQGVNPAVAYLAMASGTGRDHISTAWSSRSVVKYTGASKNRAKAAVERLVESGLIYRTVAGTKPRYKFATWAQMQGLAPRSAELTEERTAVLKLIRENAILCTKEERQIARDLVDLNRVRWEVTLGRWVEIISPEPKLAFIPNAFVTGVADETPPLERLRRLQDPLLLRLTVDLYHHHFENDGGIPKTIIRRKYARQLKATFGPYAVYEFQDQGQTGLIAYGGEVFDPHATVKDARPDWFMVWRRLDDLEKTGILEWVPILFEAASDDAEPLFPLGHGGTDSIEDRLGDTAHRAAKRMLSRRYNLSSDAPALGKPTASSQLVPLYQNFEQATLYGIARLRYRAQTARTATWFSEVERRSAEYLEKWRQIIDNVELRDGTVDAACG